MEGDHIPQTHRHAPETVMVCMGQRRTRKQGRKKKERKEARVWEGGKAREERKR
jgi:hypothetical protein